MKHSTKRKSYKLIEQNLKMDSALKSEKGVE